MRDKQTKALRTLKDIVRDKIAHMRSQISELQRCLDTMADIEEEIAKDAREQASGGRMESEEWRMEVKADSRLSGAQEVGNGAVEPDSSLVLDAEEPSDVGKDLAIDKKQPRLLDLTGQRDHRYAVSQGDHRYAASKAHRSDSVRGKTKKPRKVSVTSALKEVLIESGGRNLKLDEIAALTTQKGVTVRRPSLSALISNFVTGAKDFPRGRVLKVSRGVFRWEDSPGNPPA